jgi:DNA-binding GntR family transcriptional regulator
MNAIPDVLEARDANLSMAESAYRQVRDKLITLEIRPGAPINEGTLATELSIGRTPLREALKRLERDHLVVSYPRRGTFATMVDITELAQISDIRLSLEPLAARRAAEGATPAARDELRRLAASIAELEAGSSDPRALMRFDIAVHRAIYHAAGNEHLEDVLIRYDNLAVRIWFLVLNKLPHVSGHVTEHAELLHAIIDGDAERAAKLTHRHVTDFEQSIRTVL